MVGPIDVSLRAEALVTTRSVFADLALDAFVGPFATLVYVQAMLAGYGVQSVTGRADHSGDASEKFPRVRVIVPGCPLRCAEAEMRVGGARG